MPRAPSRPHRTKKLYLWTRLSSPNALLLFCRARVSPPFWPRLSGSPASQTTDAAAFRADASSIQEIEIALASKQRGLARVDGPVKPLSDKRTDTDAPRYCTAGCRLAHSGGSTDIACEPRRFVSRSEPFIVVRDGAIRHVTSHTNVPPRGRNRMKRQGN